MGPHCPLRDLLQEQGIKRKYWKRVLEGLHCPSCYTDFTEVWDEVETKTEYDKQVERILDKAQSPKLIKDLSVFHHFLENYPYLGLADPRGMGKNVLERIEAWPASELKPQDWYRARRINAESRIFKPDEMCAANPEEVFVSEGRYNHTGQSFLYLTDSPKTAFNEIRRANENLCAIQKFKATESIKVLDLRYNYFSNINPVDDFLAIALIYNGSLTRRPVRSSSWKPEYFVPRFIADCARLKGYDGIWFSSAMETGGENLVVFPQKIATFKPVGECKPFYLSTEENKTTLS